MFVQQLYTNCLAHAAYYVESDGEVLIIDPLRDPQPYIDLATSRNAKIKYVFETHFHADFVSGHQELAALTGAVVLFGPCATPSYDALVAADEQSFTLGKTSFTVLHTPGHTVESSCILLLDENNKPYALFSGDTIFAGDVGRPDLLSGNLSKEVLAAMLFESINKKIKPLADDVIIYPGHGAGSACGKSIGKETVTTVGDQRQKNYALKINDEKEFIKAVTSGIPSPPPYFFKDATINKTGVRPLAKVKQESMIGLKPDQVMKLMQSNALVLDTRTAADFSQGFMKGAINIGLNGDYATWAGTLIDFDTQLILFTDKGKAEESMNRLARIGYDRIAGYADFSLEEWISAGGEMDSIENIQAEELCRYVNELNYELIDVRRPGEREKMPLSQSNFVTLSELKKKLSTFNNLRGYLICCAGGYRSMIAASLLKANGIHRIVNLSGGANCLKEKGHEWITVKSEESVA